MEHCDRAAQLTRAKMLLPFAQRDPEGCTPGHLAWLLDQLEMREVTGNKAHRWLGYAQGMAVMLGLASLKDMALANGQASDEERTGLRG